MKYGVGIRTQYPLRWKGYGTPHNRRNVAKCFSSCVKRSIEHVPCEADRDRSTPSVDKSEHSLGGSTSTPGLDPITSPDPPQRGRPRARAVANSPDVPKRARGRPRIVPEAPEHQTLNRQRGRPRIRPQASKLDVAEQERDRLQAKVITLHWNEEPISKPEAKEHSLNSLSSTTSLAESPIVRGLQGRGRGSRLDRGQIVSPELCGKSLWRVIHAWIRYSRCASPITI